MLTIKATTKEIKNFLKSNLSFILLYYIDYLYKLSAHAGRVKKSSTPLFFLSINKPTNSKNYFVSIKLNTTLNANATVNENPKLKVPCP